MNLFGGFPDPDDEGDERKDYFEEDIKPAAPKPPKEPEPKPDEPEYWDREEPEWEHLRPRRRLRIYIWLGVAVAVIALVLAVWNHWFSPSVEEAVKYGYIEEIQKENHLLFTTYEGVILPYREMMDTTRVYREDFPFSVADETIAASLKRMERVGKPVRVEYNVYRATLPWRGRSVNVITRVDSVDASRILPPEFRPEFNPDSISKGKKSL